MLTQAGAVHQNFEENRDMMFSIMQSFADELKLGVTIDFDFINNSSNDNITNTISSYMKTVFGTNIVIPYQINNKTGLVSSLGCLNLNR